MFQLTTTAGKLRLNAARLSRSVDIAVDRSVSSQAFSIRDEAYKSIKRAAKKRKGGKRGRIAKPRGATVSKPGSPPLFHRNRFFPSRIRYAYNRNTKIAVIGPQKTTSKGVPRALERGGVSIAKNGGRVIRQRVKARPFMLPSHLRLLPRFVHRFRGSVRA